MTLLLGINLGKYKTARSGVIVYTIVNNKIQFLLAKDAVYNEYGDFGGGVKKMECALMGGLREFRQESREIFDKELYQCNSATHSIALVDFGRKMSILFLKVDPKWYNNAVQIFEEKKREIIHNDIKKNPKCTQEMSEILWIDETTLQKHLSSKNIITTNISTSNNTISTFVLWSKIKEFLSKNITEEFWNAIRTAQ